MLGGGLIGRRTLVLGGATLSCVALLGWFAGSGALAGGLRAQVSADSSAALIARLAVLRRPQTPADVLPSSARLPSLDGARIMPALTRLVATPPDVSVYLAVFTPVTRGSPPLWSPSLGDQVALVWVTSQGADLTAPVPAAELADGNRVALIGFLPRVTHSTGPDYQVGIVPDGVARVAWTFANGADKHRYAVSVAIANNVGVVPFHRGTLFLSRATWYAADGTVVPISDRALRHAIAVRQSIMRKRLIREDARVRYRPPRSLLDAFAVFTVTSRHGVRVGGLTISHPALSALPLPILNITVRGPSPPFNPELNPNDIRQATTRAGRSVWIIPGQHGLCVAQVDKPRFPFLYGGGAGMGCNPNIANAIENGSGISSGQPGGVWWNYGVLPTTKPTLRIRTGPHSHRTIRPPDGVYIYRTGGWRR
jgi:hypothetical protein